MISAAATEMLGFVKANDLAGELDTILPPRFCHAAAQAIPNARCEVMPGEAHQPFQEVSDQFNARVVDAFWRDGDRRG